MSCRRFAPALLACVLAVAMAASAQAAPKSVVGVVGEGDFGASSPRAVAVNATTGDVYVVDGTGHRVRRYSAAGAFLSELGTGGAAALGGRFNTPNGVAVDPGDGSLWVTDSGNTRVQRFGPPDAFGAHPFDVALGWDVMDGGATAFETCGPSDTCKSGVTGDADGQFGGDASSFTGHAAVDPVSGGVYVSDPVNRRIQRFDAATGAFEAKFGGAALFGGWSPTSLATDSTGGIYAVDGANDRVLRCHSTGGAPEGFFCSAFAGATLSGSSPFAVAVDGDDRVFVARRPAPEFGNPADVPIQVVELEPDGDVVEVHAAGAGITSSLHAAALLDHGGLAVNRTTGTLYLSVPSWDDTGRVVVLGDAPPAPTAALAPVTGITAESATFNGTVNPNGGPTGHRFEYRVPGSAWSRIPTAAGNHGAGTTDVPVTETVTGLEPNTTYELRLVADRLYGADVATSVQTFHTGAAMPAVSGQHAAPDDTAVALEAEIDPQSSSTTYRFEYGTDAAYGNQTPARDAGAGAAPVRVVERVTGLQPGTSYHFRVVATNAAGTTEGPDRTFTTDGAAPPAGRAYELVTPPGGEAEVRITGGGLRPATPDGNHVCIASPFSMGGAPPAGGTLTDDVYCAHRGDSGWATEWISQPRGQTNVPLTATGAVFKWISDDGARKTFSTHFMGLVPERPMVEGDDYHDGYLRVGDRTEWTTPATPFSGESRQNVAASADLTHLVYHAGGRVYEWTPAGARVVSVDHTGTPAPGTTNLGNSSEYGTGLWALPGTISRDGSRIFFESDAALTPDDSAPASDVYLRENGAVTRLVSKRTAPGATEPVTFAGASDDGGTAYLLTTGRLTGDAATDTALYRYDVASDATSLVEDGVTSVLAVSQDGSTVVMSGTDVLSPADGLSLYVARGGQTTRISGLAPTDVADWFGADHRVGAASHALRALRLSADGSVVAFRAEAETPGVPGVYRWSAAGGRELVSRDADGAKVDAGFGNSTQALVAPGNGYNAGRGMTDDGSTLFFETAATLDARDVNGDIDVYQWRGGRTRLVTPGGVAGDARYLDNSADGSTVFFTTYERIRPRQDRNGARDLYAARAGGGFADPPDGTVGTPPAVQPPATAPPGPGSDSGAPRDGEQASDPRPVLSVRRPGATALRRLAAGRRVPLRVTLTGGGTVAVNATAVVRGKRRTVARGSRRADPRAQVPLRLSEAARAKLRRAGRLPVQIVVRTSSGAEARSMTVVVRAARKQG